MVTPLHSIKHFFTRHLRSSKDTPRWCRYLPSHVTHQVLLKLDRLPTNGSRHMLEFSIRLRLKDVLGGRKKTSPFSAGGDLF